MASAAASLPVSALTFMLPLPHHLDGLRLVGTHHLAESASLAVVVVNAGYAPPAHQNGVVGAVEPAIEAVDTAVLVEHRAVQPPRAREVSVGTARLYDRPPGGNLVHVSHRLHNHPRALVQLFRPFDHDSSRISAPARRSASSLCSDVRPARLPANFFS